MNDLGKTPAEISRKPKGLLADRRPCTRCGILHGILMPIIVAAAHIGVSRWEIQDLLKTGALRCVPLNGNPRKRRIYLNDAESWIEEHLVRGNLELNQAMDRRRRMLS